jgi:hypothetical protein
MNIREKCSCGARIDYVVGDEGMARDEENARQFVASWREEHLHTSPRRDIVDVPLLGSAS